MTLYAIVFGKVPQIGAVEANSVEEARALAVLQWGIEVIDCPVINTGIPTIDSEDPYSIKDML